MKQILLKTGILLFCYTLIISNHIEKSKYFMIEDFIKRPPKSFDNNTRDNMRQVIIPRGKYIPEEKHLNYLSTYPNKLRNLVITNSSEKILPFENSINVLTTLFFLLSITIIVIAIDLNSKFILNNKVLFLTIPLLFYLFISLNSGELNPIIGTNPDTESDISIIKSDINDLESNQSDLEGRVSDLEY